MSMPRHLYGPHTEGVRSCYVDLNETTIRALRVISEQQINELGAEQTAERELLGTTLLLANRGLVRYVLDGPKSNKYQLTCTRANERREVLEQLPALDRDDLLQACFVTIFRTSLMWNSTLGASFSEYERGWLMTTVKRTIDNTGRTIKIPTKVLEQLRCHKRTESGRAVRLYYRGLPVLDRDGEDCLPVAVPLIDVADTDENQAPCGGVAVGHEFAAMVPDIPPNIIRLLRMSFSRLNLKR